MSPQSTVPLLCRLHDRYIMEAIIVLPRVSKAQIRTFNSVRLYLQVTLLSEISTADGKQIALDAWQVVRPRHTSSLWPFQEEPTAESIRLWQTLLHHAFLSCHRTPRHNPPTWSLLLVSQMGHWLPDSHWLQSKWSAFYSYDTHVLYYMHPHTSPNSYGLHVHKPRSRHRNPKFEIVHTETTTTLPPSTIPVDARFEGTAITFPSVTRSAPPYPQDNNGLDIQESFDDYLSQLPLWERELIHSATLRPDCSMPELLRLLTDPAQTLILGSDGGAKGDVGSFGAIIATPGNASHLDGQIFVEMGGIAYGHNPSSFRAESYGQLAPLQYLVHVQSYFAITVRCSLLFLLDNAGRLMRTERLIRKHVSSPRRCLLSDYDLDLQIQAALTALNHTAHIGSEHIKSHQDENATGPLPWKVQINTVCDAIATDILESHRGDSFPDVPFLPASSAALTLANTTVTTSIPTAIRLHCGAHLPHSNDKTQLEYLCRTHGWDLPLCNKVDWQAFSQSLVPDDLQHFCVRWINHILPIMQRQHRWKLEPSPLCPALCECEEDDAHLLHCPHPDRVELHTTLYTQITATFNPHHVDPGLRQIIKAFLAVPNPAVDHNLDHLPSQHQQLYQLQLALGPLSPFYGFFHQEWVRLQNDYLIGQGLPHNKNQACVLISKWAHLFLTSARAQWTARNSFLHEDTTTNTAHVRVLLKLRIQELYAQQETIPEYDRRQLFGNSTMEQRMDLPPLRQKEWIASTRALLKNAQRKANKPPAGNSDIRSFFTPSTHAKGRHSGRPPG